MLPMKSGKWLFLIFLILVGLSGIFIIPYSSMPDASEKLDLKTSDGVKIAANLRKASGKENGWLILVHMLPTDKESWDNFAKDLQGFGYASLALDLRGHGESEGGPTGYLKFSDEEHQAGINDLEAAWDYLKSNGADPAKTYLIGASIGANLSLQLLINHPELAGGVLLSPGNYRGIDSARLVKKLSAGQKILFAASRKDERAGGNNAQQNQQYYNSAAQVKIRHLVLFDGAGHGTDLFNLKEEFDLMDAIKKFLTNGNIN